MKKILVAAALLVSGLVSGTAYGGDSHTIIQRGRAFRPAEIAIARGDSITFTNEDSYIHQIYAEGLFDSQEKAPGENLNEIFTQSGTFQLRCHIHPTMKMVVHVK